jgi:amphi-Trp domain-containing protein
MPREVTRRGDIVAKPLAVRQSRTVSAKAVVPVSPAVEQPAPVARPPAERERVTAAIPAKFHGRARRDAAAFYLTQLARGVLAGELAIAVGEQEIQLATAEFVVLKIEVKQRKRANHVSVKLRWPRRPLIRVAAAGGSRDGR